MGLVEHAKGASRGLVTGAANASPFLSNLHGLLSQLNNIRCRM